MSDAPLISIVLPVYGTEAYVGRAISSIRNQSFEDWELIVVDDCTPDGAANIARGAALRDGRIRLVSHEVNRGLSEARNTGISQARGTWVWIPDSDDYFDTDLLERAVATMKDGPDLIMFGLVEEYYDAHGKHLYDNPLPMDEAIFPEPTDWHSKVISWERGTHLGYAWNKLYRLDRIRELGLVFEKVRLIEDVLFAMAYLRDAKAIAVLSGTPYHYAKRRGYSLTGANAFSAKEYFGLLERRVDTLAELLGYWDVFDDGAKAALGGLYCRFVVSALERTYFRGESWSHAERCAWLDEIRGSELYQRFVPTATSGGSKTVGLAIDTVRSGSDFCLLAFARTTYFAHTHSYSLFTRLRSRR